VDPEFPIPATASPPLGGTPISPRSPPALLDYELLRVIGSGSYGDVWRIQNQLRKRKQQAPVQHARTSTSDPGRASDSTDDANRTATVERVADPTVPEFGAEWDAAWEKNLLSTAMTRIRDRIDERQFQSFDLYVTKGWLPSEVAKTLGISVARVYLTKHRVAAMLKQEVRRLEKAAEQSLRKRN